MGDRASVRGRRSEMCGCIRVAQCLAAPESRAARRSTMRPRERSCERRASKEADSRERYRPGRAGVFAASGDGTRRERDAPSSATAEARGGHDGGSGEGGEGRSSGVA